MPTLSDLVTGRKETLGDALLGRRSGSLVDLLRQYGSGVKHRLGLLADDPAEFARGALLDVVPNDAEAQAAQNRLMGGEVDPQAYRNYIGKMQDLGGLLASIRVYHGSPHKFDKFDLSKIGTGEGAQAYGHGLYMAESPEVAKEYARRLAESHSPLSVEPRGDLQKEVQEWAENLVKQYGGPLQNRNEWLSVLPDNADFKAARQFGDDDAAFKALNRLIKRAEKGNLYEANLRWPDAAREAADPMGPQHFLDWDAPLSKQPAAVREIMAPYVAPMRAIEAKTSGAEWGDLAAPRDYDPTGSELLKLFRGGLDRMDADTVLSGGIGPEVSAALRAKGIPGIRYLDAGSRAAGGTSNYVVFDDMLIDILTRNGKPIK